MHIGARPNAEWKIVDFRRTGPSEANLCEILNQIKEIIFQENAMCWRVDTVRD